MVIDRISGSQHYGVEATISLANAQLVYVCSILEPKCHKVSDARLLTFFTTFLT